MQHWNDYWKEGYLTSFGSSFTGNYQGVYARYWASILESIDTKSEVLDLATGNAAIPLLGRQISSDNQLGLRFVGTDLAQVDRALIAKQLNASEQDFPEDFTIISGVDSANLPFEENRFSCVTSQYGFEYGDINETLKQISRVSKSSALISLVIHHSDSVILQRNNQTLECLHQLTKPDGLLSLLSDLVKAMGELSNKFDLALLKGNKKTDKARNKFNQAVSTLESEFQVGFLDTNVAELITGLFKQYMFNSRAQKYQLISQFKLSAKSHMERLQDLKDAAFDVSQIQQLISDAQLTKLTLVDKDELIDQEKGLLGWTITFKNEK